MAALRDPQWEKFASELAELKAPIDAYKAAGYAPHRGNASRLARRAEVRARVKELLDEAAEFANVRRVRIVNEIDRVGRANLVDFFEWDDERKQLRLKNLTDLPRELTAALASIEWDDAGRPKIKLHDKNQANFTLLKYLGGMPEPPPSLAPTNIFNFLSIDDQRALADALERTLIESQPGGEKGADREAA